MDQWKPFLPGRVIRFFVSFFFSQRKNKGYESRVLDPESPEKNKAWLLFTKIQGYRCRN